MSKENSLLVAQSFIVTAENTYWDYRDYLCCLTSNLSLKDATFRLNIERGQEWIPEFQKAADQYGFSDFTIKGDSPPCWSDFMLAQIAESNTRWTMPWPGDHIYIHPDDEAFTKLLNKADVLNADSFAYSHVQDFDYFLDWNRVKVLYNDDDYIMIEWGNDHWIKGKNPSMMKQSIQLIGNEILTTPVPGFVVYRSDMLQEILEALPSDNNRWQHMEYSTAACASSFKLLLPKSCLYRHVHGYWLEGFLKYWKKSPFPGDIKAEIDTWYLPTEYDFSIDHPTRHDYRKQCLAAHPYFKKYLNSDLEVSNPFGSSPFDTEWNRPPALLVNAYHTVLRIYRALKRLAKKLLFR